MGQGDPVDGLFARSIDYSDPHASPTRPGASRLLVFTRLPPERLMRGRVTRLNGPVEPV
jgi:hypothetical protein